MFMRDIGLSFLVMSLSDFLYQGNAGIMESSGRHSLFGFIEKFVRIGMSFSLNVS